MKEGNNLKNLFIKKGKVDEEKYNHKNISLKEENSDDEESEDEIKNLNKSENEDKNSMSDLYDGEFVSLEQIDRFVENERKNEKGLRGRLLNRKNLLEKKDIIFDAKQGGIIDSFSPSIDELDIFLMHCQVQKISLDSFAHIPNDDNNDSIAFDPNEWMKTNKMEKRIINMEDLSLYCNEKTSNSNQTEYNGLNIRKNTKIKENKKEAHKKEKGDTIEMKEEKSQIKKEINENIPIFKDRKFKDNYRELQKIISSEFLTISQKKWLTNFLNEINEIDINEILIKNEKKVYEKLELVFDLDNTCVFSFLTHPNYSLVKSKQNIYSDKNVKMISFNYENKVLYSMLIIRKGLKEFVEYIKPFCNFHISTLGAETYGNEIKNILSEYCKINFERFKGRIYKYEYEKNISDLYIERRNTIIIDDNMCVWCNQEKDNENVIISKYFFDEECAINNENPINKEKVNNEEQINNINIFLTAYRGFNYNKILDNNIDWRKQEIMEYKNIPFYQFKNNEDSNNLNYNKCFTAEYLNSEKFQFIYMKNVIKQIYCLKFIYNIDIPLAIKLIRIGTLTNIIFHLKYLSTEQRIILTDIVKVCGGIILEKDYKISNEKVYLVASKNIFDFNKEKIKADLKINPFFILINERFILDTYYFMTNITENINDPEYKFDELN